MIFEFCDKEDHENEATPGGLLMELRARVGVVLVSIDYLTRALGFRYLLCESFLIVVSLLCVQSSFECYLVSFYKCDPGQVGQVHVNSYEQCQLNYNSSQRHSLFLSCHPISEILSDEVIVKFETKLQQARCEAFLTHLGTASSTQSSASRQILPPFSNCSHFTRS